MRQGYFSSLNSQPFDRLSAGFCFILFYIYIVLFILKTCNISSFKISNKIFLPKSMCSMLLSTIIWRKKIEWILISNHTNKKITSFTILLEYSAMIQWEILLCKFVTLMFVSLAHVQHLYMFVLYEQMLPPSILQLPTDTCQQIRKFIYNESRSCYQKITSVRRPQTGQHALDLVPERVMGNSVTWMGSSGSTELLKYWSEELSISWLVSVWQLESTAQQRMRPKK